MAVSISKTKNGPSIVIDGDLTIFMVALYRDSLLAFDDYEGQVSIDLQAVDEVDSAGIQLLLSLISHLKALHCHYRLTTDNEALVDGLKLMNLHSLLSSNQGQHDE